MFQAARNRFRSHRRWSLLDRERLADWGWLQTTAEPASPLRQASHKEQTRALEHAIARLPLRYREVVLLVAVEGFETEDVATMLAITPAALRQRLALARGMLRKTVEHEP